MAYNPKPRTIRKYSKQEPIVPTVKVEDIINENQLFTSLEAEQHTSKFRLHANTNMKLDRPIVLGD